MDPVLSPRQIAQHIEQLREKRLRRPGQPTLAERRVFGRTQAGLRARMRLWGDPTLGALMKDAAGELTRRQKAVAIAAAAWRDLIPKDFNAPTTLVSFARGVLVVSVPDQASRYVLDRMLRAGGLTHFIRSVPIAVRDVRIVVGGVAEPIAPIERREESVDDREKRRLDEIDVGGDQTQDDQSTGLRRLWQTHSGQ